MLRTLKTLTIGPVDGGDEVDRKGQGKAPFYFLFLFLHENRSFWFDHIPRFEYCSRDDFILGKCSLGT